MYYKRWWERVDDHLVTIFWGSYSNTQFDDTKPHNHVDIGPRISFLTLLLLSFLVHQGDHSKVENKTQKHTYVYVLCYCLWCNHGSTLEWNLYINIYIGVCEGLEKRREQNKRKKKKGWKRKVRWKNQSLRGFVFFVVAVLGIRVAIKMLLFSLEKNW